MPAGLVEVDRVLGGGIVPGSVVLLGGDPGIGKSTIALQVSHSCGNEVSPALYCTGEESLEQLALRARRLGCTGARVRLLVESDVDTVIATIEAERPSLVVVDSVQTLRDPATPGPAWERLAGSRGGAAHERGRQGDGVPVLLVGHVTKEGAIAGPRTLEHMVDVVLYLEGERLGEHRMLARDQEPFRRDRRGGPAQHGARRHARSRRPEPGHARRRIARRLGQRADRSPATGSGRWRSRCRRSRWRPRSGSQRRTASGFELNRLHLMLAVLAKRAGNVVSKMDVFVNVAGGIRLADPGTDLAVALAVAGAAKNLAMSRQLRGDRGARPWRRGSPGARGPRCASPRRRPSGWRP